MLHGGDLGWAMEAYGGQKEDWLDLSTGINRRSYPFSIDRALSDIRELPSTTDLKTCLEAARLAYQCPKDLTIVAGPGTQILINSIPHILKPGRCHIAEPTYSEHRGAMELAGVPCSGFTAIDDLLAQNIDQRSCVIVVNPNNPDGHTLSSPELLEFSVHLQKSNSTLIIDEAFGDIDPTQSIIPHLSSRSNIVVFRSFGKFFGLAGIRLGFVIGSEEITNKITSFHGPWTASSVALKVGSQALSDLEWHKKERELLTHWSERLQSCLARHGLSVVGGTGLYLLIESEYARRLHMHLAKHHIWSRIFTYQDRWLRLGIPMQDAELKRFVSALDCFVVEAAND
ncbi:threonine-phosphate decarboxylase CobD [Cohaesibacter gelatinilyticus]|uniref:threonine-phosphate decarboxylase n=1 Tax=Cohaesibacter gelatinilyticus TaxID=372072 RepID=A0A285NI54_9HYPH|nr:threonine-phosphate decarboxylase CobD [Cohaesibacter gelatinilyticus]SNZ07546.1 L-threonine O-3-phosphate decarboxylase [Cohaesibacter gelatinilyticus]HAT84790.1 threonine-phosphate decarboxylase [Hyphomicrobiales bacterium]